MNYPISMQPLQISPTANPLVKLATPRDLSFICSLQKKFSDELGFLPRAALEQYIVNSRVLTATQNGLEAGYLLGRSSMKFDRRITPITQAAICMDARRADLGRALVNAWCESARTSGSECVQCWCAADIDAMKFWPACGFIEIGRRRPENSRGRDLVLWRRPLVETFDALHALQPTAGYRNKINPAILEPTISLQLDLFA